MARSNSHLEVVEQLLIKLYDMGYEAHWKALKQNGEELEITLGFKPKKPQVVDILSEVAGSFTCHLCGSVFPAGSGHVCSAVKPPNVFGSGTSGVTYSHCPSCGDMLLPGMGHSCHRPQGS